MSSTKIQKQDLDMDSLASAIQSLMNSGVISMSAVKSVQRGKYKFTDKSNATITINSINPDKCMVLLDNGVVGIMGSSNTYHKAYGTTLVSLTETSLTLSSNYTPDSSAVYGNISWQVIEYA